MTTIRDTVTYIIQYLCCVLMIIHPPTHSRPFLPPVPPPLTRATIIIIIPSGRLLLGSTVH